MTAAALPASPAALRWWRAAEHALDRATTPQGNPLRHLGSAAFLFLWLLAVSGVALFAWFDTSVASAYDSLTRLGRFGVALRSLHRFAADAFTVTMIAHLVREALHGRFSGFRRYSWWSGLPLLLLSAAAAIGGFWLAWDQLAQFSATATAEWLDALPWFATPLTRNVLTDGSITDRLFSLLVFVHLGVALLIVFALWAHVQRLAHAEVFPPRPLALGSTLALLALALVWPIAAIPRAALALAPQKIPLDWWLLNLHPLTEAISATAMHALIAALLAALVLLPFMSRTARAPVAQVHGEHCNGCRRCFDDCPYEAITMAPHPHRSGRQIAVVAPALCAGCGICTGACPSSTPFRKGERLVTGIDMPQQPIDGLRETLRERLQAVHGPRRIVVFGCHHGAPVEPLAADDVAAVSMLCTGMLPPAFVEHALRHGADEVVVASCRDGGCEFRLGARWTAQRLAGMREPRLRSAAPLERVHHVEADREELDVLQAAIATLRRRGQEALA